MSQIKVGLDTSAAKKSLMDLANFSKKSMGKGGISLLDKASSKILSGEAGKVIEKLERQTERLKSRAQDYAREVKSAAGNAERELKAREKLLAVTSRLAKTEGERSKLGELQEKLGGGPSMGSGMMSALGKTRIGGMLAKLGGGGALAGMALGGAAIGAGVYGYSRLSSGYDRYSGGLDSRIKLRGKGARDTEITGGRQGAFSQIGMNEEDVRQARIQSMDIFGRAGSTQSEVLRRGQFARNYGIDMDSMQGMGAGMRAQTNVKGANRDMLRLQASLQASEIKDAIGPYLETAANMLTDIRQNGLVDSKEVLGLMATLTKLTGNSPERLAGQIAGFQRAVQGSSGENNAFFQTAFARAGIGGGNMGGTQAAIRSGGIFGVNANDYGGLSKDSKSTLAKLGLTGSGQSMEKRIGSIMGLADQTFSGSSPESKLAKARFMMPKLGAKNEVESMEMMDEFKAAQGNPVKMKQFEEKLKDKNSSPEERMLKNLESINRSQDGAVQALQKIRDDQEEYMGRQVAPAAMLMSKALLHIDELIGFLYKGIAHVIPGLNSDAGKNAEELQAEIAQAKSDKAKPWWQQSSNSLDNGSDEHIAYLEGLLKRLDGHFDASLEVQRKQLEVQREHHDTSKKNNAYKVPNRPLVLAPAKSGKTR